MQKELIIFLSLMGIVGIAIVIFILYVVWKITDEEQQDEDPAPECKCTIPHYSKENICRKCGGAL